MLDLIGTGQSNKNVIKLINLQKLSSYAFLFDIEYERALIKGNGEYYWRLVGANNNDLFSLYIIDGSIANVELHCLNKTRLEQTSYDYCLGSNCDDFFPLFNLLPSNESFKVDVYKTIIDNYVDISILLSENATRVSWKSDNVFRTCLVQDIIAFEFSEKNQLIGIVIFANIKHIPSEDKDDIISKQIYKKNLNIEYPDEPKTNSNDTERSPQI